MSDVGNDAVKLPRNVKLFAWLWIASNLMDVPALLLMPSSSATEVLTNVLLIGVLTATVFAILLPFFWLAVWRRKNWARWILFAVFLVALIDSIAFPEPELFHLQSLQFTELYVGSFVLQGIAFYYLFTGDARTWFRKQSAAQIGADDAFS